LPRAAKTAAGRASSSRTKQVIMEKQRSMNAPDEFQDTT